MVQLVIVCLSLLAVLCCQPTATAKPKPTPFTAQQSLLKWINGYRARPEPERLPEAVHAMHRLGLFRDLDAGGVYVGFMAGVLAANPDKADRLVAGMFPMPPEHQVVIVRAIAYSGLPNWKELLHTFVERMPARRVLIQRHLDDKLPVLAKLPLAGNASALDANWGFYFATGRHDAVDRILDTLEWVKDRNDVERLTTGSMAKWTLANNALQDKELLDHLKSEMNRRPKPVKAQISEVIEAAETYETAKIRKEAQDAVEEIKRKGPASTRKLTFWGQAGTTAIALGCVVAGVLGHPEVGVPCVIGGAVSSAALKVLTPQ